MASVFLSYVHEDIERARALAGHFERAGHTVWWDRHIRGGRSFSDEIEAALAAADKVVVLWSERSIHSAWVRDEAAVGRDSGRLVPIMVDRSKPPLGFRQFQTIDLSSWKGRPPAAKLEELLDAIADLSTPARDPATASRSTSRVRWAAPRPAFLGILVIALALIIGGWWWSTRAAAHMPVVAIDSGSNSPQSREAARQLAVRLGDVQATRSDAFQLMSGSGNADLIFRVDATDEPTGSSRDLTVLSGENGSILWSTSLQQPAAKASGLSQQLALTSERVLTCALEALADARDRIDPQTLKMYVTGCLRLEGLYGNAQYNPEVLSLFEKVVAKAPHFEGCWAKLLSAESEIVISPDPPPALVSKLRRHIAQAERLGSQMGEIYHAKAALLPTSDYLGRFALYSQAIKSDPDNPLVYRIMSERLLGVGRMMDSVQGAGEALRLDPQSPAVLDNYISALAYAGQADAAYVQLRRAEVMWPTARNIHFARYRLDLRFGDPKEALSIYENEMAGQTTMGQVLFLKARINPTPENIQRAIDSARAVYLQDPRDIEGLVQALGQFGRKDEAIDELLHYKRTDAIGYNSEVFFRPALREIWRDPRAIAAAAHVGLLRYWKKSGRWPDFCSDPTLPYDCRKEAEKYRV